MGMKEKSGMWRRTGWHKPGLGRWTAVGLLAGCALLVGGAGLGGGGCAGSPGGGTDATGSSDALRQYPLATLPTCTVKIGTHDIRAWVAQDFDRQRPGVTQEGLMFVRPAEIADDQGMLFVFRDERVRGFWMRNTITPLDIAFARYNGEIVKIQQMPPLTLDTYSSVEPAMFALEVKQGTFGRLGIKEGDVLVVPDVALQAAP
jgi:uncharacterized protein